MKNVVTNLKKRAMHMLPLMAGAAAFLATPTSFASTVAFDHSPAHANVFGEQRPAPAKNINLAGLPFGFASDIGGATSTQFLFHPGDTAAGSGGNAYQTFVMLHPGQEHGAVAIASSQAARHAEWPGLPGGLAKSSGFDEVSTPSPAEGPLFGFEVPSIGRQVLSDSPLGNRKEVPLPAAAWLFGSALLGFVMMSTRGNA